MASGDMHLAGHVRTFLTHSEGRPRTWGVLIDRRGARNRISRWQLRALAELANNHPGACAYGKIVLVRTDGISTFQTRPGRDPSRTFCGNSAAAGLSCLATEGSISTRIHGTGRRSYDVNGRIVGAAIAQQWLVPSEGAQLRNWRGCRALFLTTLNHYAILLDPLPPAMGPADALRELGASALANKLAIVSDIEGIPFVEFHNANGRHGAAPQTGIATLALAARTSPWFGARFPDGRFLHATTDGPQTSNLPSVVEAACGRLAIDMPSVSVRLDHALVEEAA